MRTYNIAFTAGQTQYFAGGNSLHLITATSGIDIEYLKADLTNINQTASDVESGYNVIYDEGFDLVKITNGATPQTIKFGIARGGKGGYNIGSSQLTGGTVDEVTNIVSLDRVDVVGEVQHREALNGNWYSTGSVLTSTATQYGLMEIWNPFASGQNVIVHQFDIEQASAASLATQIKVTHVTANYGITGIFAENKLIDTGSTSYVGVDTPTALAGGSIVKHAFLPAGGGRVVQCVKPDYPIILQSGKGLLAQALTLNTTLIYNVEYEVI